MPACRSDLVQQSIERRERHSGCTLVACPRGCVDRDASQARELVDGCTGVVGDTAALWWPRSSDGDVERTAPDVRRSGCGLDDCRLRVSRQPLGDHQLEWRVLVLGENTRLPAPAAGRPTGASNGRLHVARLARVGEVAALADEFAMCRYI